MPGIICFPAAHFAAVAAALPKSAQVAHWTVLIPPLHISAALSGNCRYSHISTRPIYTSRAPAQFSSTSLVPPACRAYDEPLSSPLRPGKLTRLARVLRTRPYTYTCCCC